MEAAHSTCHQCAAQVPEQALFCPQCGAPQIVITEAEQQRIAAQGSGSTAAAVGAVTEGAPETKARSTGKNRIRWRPVLKIALVLALAAAAAEAAGDAMPGLAIFGVGLVFLGPLLLIGIYQRRVPGAGMSAGKGARMGAVLGLMMACLLLTVKVAGVLIYRYVQHHSAQMDDKFNAVMQKSMTQMAVSYPDIYGNPAANPAQLDMLRFFKSPDGHAAYALMVAVLAAICVVLYATISGAVAGWLRPMPPRR